MFKRSTSYIQLIIIAHHFKTLSVNFFFPKNSFTFLEKKNWNYSFILYFSSKLAPECICRNSLSPLLILYPVKMPRQPDSLLIRIKRAIGFSELVEIHLHGDNISLHCKLCSLTYTVHEIHLRQQYKTHVNSEGHQERLHAKDLKKKPNARPMKRQNSTSKHRFIQQQQYHRSQSTGSTAIRTTTINTPEIVDLTKGALSRLESITKQVDGQVLSFNDRYVSEAMASCARMDSPQHIDLRLSKTASASVERPQPLPCYGECCRYPLHVPDAGYPDQSDHSRLQSNASESNNRTRFGYDDASRITSRSPTALFYYPPAYYAPSSSAPTCEPLGLYSLDSSHTLTDLTNSPNTSHSLSEPSTPSTPSTSFGSPSLMSAQLQSPLHSNEFDGKSLNFDGRSPNLDPSATASSQVTLGIDPHLSEYRPHSDFTSLDYRSPTNGFFGNTSNLPYIHWQTPPFGTSNTGQDYPYAYNDHHLLNKYYLPSVLEVGPGHPHHTSIDQQILMGHGVQSTS